MEVVLTFGENFPLVCAQDEWKNVQSIFHIMFDIMVILVDC